MAVRMMQSVYHVSRCLVPFFPCRLTGVLALILEELGDLVSGLSIGNLDIVLGGAVVGHEGEEAIVSDVEL